MSKTKWQSFVSISEQNEALKSTKVNGNWEETGYVAIKYGTLSRFSIAVGGGCSMGTSSGSVGFTHAATEKGNIFGVWLTYEFHTSTSLRGSTSAN